MKKIFAVCCAFFTLFSGYSQMREFSSKELAIISTKSVEILQKYELLINKIGETTPLDINAAQSNAESLIELFVNRKVLVYNDLDPSHQLSEFYEAETFASNLILWYPDGISVALDFNTAKTTTIKQHDETIFSMDVAIEKKIDGNYLYKQNNNNRENLIFRIAFSFEGNTPVNFQIAGIRNAVSLTKVDDLKTLQEVNSEKLSEEELAKVYSGLKGVLNDYTNFLALLGDPEELDEDKEFYKESFSKLFKNNDIKVLNDIDPKPKTSLISVPEYMDLYKVNFPDGIKNISLNLDSAEFGLVSKNDQGILFTYVYIDKFFSAILKQKDLFKTHDNLMFKINFNKSGNSYTSFNIESIDKTGFSYFEASSSGTDEPTLAITPVTRKGLSIYGTASYGISAVADENLTSVTLDKNLHEWDVKNEYGIVIGGGVNYFFADALGISSGVELNTFSTKYSLYGSFKDNELSYDNSGNDNNHFYMIVDAQYDSTLSINALNFPILLKYNFGKPGNWGFSIDAGLKLSYVVSAKYNVSGNYKTSGHYPDWFAQIYPEGLILDDATLGFFDRTNIDESGDLDYKKMNVSGYAKLSLVIPIGFYSSFEFGPEVLYGLSDLVNNNSDYIDIFNKATPRKSLTISYFGVNVKYFYKL